VNKTQRKQLSVATSNLCAFTDADECLSLGLAACLTGVEEGLSVLTTLAEDEREKFDNMPEGLQASPTGEAIDAAAEALDEAVSHLQDAQSVTDNDEDWHETLSALVQDAIDAAENVE
jgi:cysteine sulfinate desulfinase/cysteine desulfurase-like protein